MQYFQLYIAGVAVDMGNNMEWEFLRENNLLNFDALKTDISIPVNLPATATNNRIFKSEHRLEVSSNFDGYPCQAFMHNVNLYNGVLVVTEGSRTGYQCQLVVNGCTVDLNDANLRDIEWPDFLRTQLTPAAVSSSVNDTAAESAVCFPEFIAKNYYDAPAFNAYPERFNVWDSAAGAFKADSIMAPGVFYKYMLKTYLEKRGYGLGGSFFESDAGNRCWYPTNFIIDGAYAKKQFMEAQIQVDGVGKGTWAAENVIFEAEISDTLSGYEPTTGVYTIKKAGKYTIQLQNLQIQASRVASSKRYFHVEVDMLVNGSSVYYEAWDDFTNNAHETRDHYFNATRTVTLDQSAVGGTIKILLTAWSNTENANDFKWRPTCFFKITYNPLLNPPNKINFINLVPNKTFGEVITALQKMFPLEVNFDTKQKKLLVDWSLDPAGSLPPPETDWTAYAEREYLSRKIETGYTLNYAYDSGSVAELVNPKNLEYNGLYLGGTLPVPINPNQYLYRPIDNALLRAKKDENDVLTYQFYCYHIFPLIVGNGETDITPQITPVFIVIKDGKATPSLDFKPKSEYFGTGNSDFDLQIGLYHGLQLHGAVYYPYGSPSNRNSQGVIIYPFSLYYQDPVYGLYDASYKPFLLKLVKYVEIDINFMLPFREMADLSLRQIIIINYLRFAIKQLSDVYRPDLLNIPVSATLVQLTPKLQPIIADVPPGTDGTITWNQNNIIWGVGDRIWNA